MKMNDFVTMMKHTRFMKMSEEETVAEVAKTLDVKEYLSLAKKKDIIDAVIKYSLRFEDEIYKIDGIAKYVGIVVAAVDTYTNLEFGDDIEAIYDELSASKLLPLIIATFKDEYELLLGMLDLKCTYILESNSLESQVGKFIHAVEDGFSGTVGDAVEAIKGLLTEGVSQ